MGASGAGKSTLVRGPGCHPGWQVPRVHSLQLCAVYVVARFCRALRACHVSRRQVAWNAPAAAHQPRPARTCSTVYLRLRQALSGAGARAQLKILACNISGGCLVGDILVNGSPVSPKEFRKQSAVVWQSDVLLATATVRSCTRGLHRALARACATPRNRHSRKRCIQPLRQRCTQACLLYVVPALCVAALTVGERIR